MNLKTDIFGPYSTCVIGDLPDKLKPVVGVVHPHIHHPPPKLTGVYIVHFDHHFEIIFVPNVHRGLQLGEGDGRHPRIKLHLYP